MSPVNPGCVVSLKWDEAVVWCDRHQQCEKEDQHARSSSVLRAPSRLGWNNLIYMKKS